MGVSFDRWQDGFGTVALGCRDNGKFAATIGGVVASIPRQVGKTFTVGHLLIALCLEIPGLRVVWTSHHNRTTTNTFRSMQGMVRKRKVWPQVAPNGVRTANGEQEIRFTNGSIILFGAREHGFGRGMDAVDILVFDEAQILGLKALEDMVPATNQARNPHGALVFFIGTPPRPIDDGEAFTAKRKRALSGDARDMVYVELSADEDADVDDLDQIAKANPSFPHRTPIEAIRRMQENIPDDASQRREMMGIWDANSSLAEIDPLTWDAAKDPASMAIENLALGVSATPDRMFACVSLAGQRADGNWHVEVDEQRGGLAWTVTHVAERCAKNKIRAVVIDALDPAASLVDDFKKAGVHVTVTSTPQAATAFALLHDGVTDTRDVRHINQPQLNVALSIARARKLQLGKVWDQLNSPGDITPVTSGTSALWGAKNTTVKKPTRKRSNTRRAVVL